MKATIHWQGEARFEGESGSGHRVLMEGPRSQGGQNTAPRPMEMVLMGLGGCAAFDVVHILRKSRENPKGCTVELRATRAEQEPKVFTHIHLHFRVQGAELRESRVRRAVELSAQKYCSASLMLERGGVRISHDYTITS